MSEFLVASNWKMYKSPREAREFFNEFKEQNIELVNQKVVFFVPAVDLTTAQVTLKDTDYGWGPQNTFYANEGAYTGETSPQVVSEMGATYGLVGHSERRTLFAENNDFLAKKVAALQAQGIVPIYCIGETLQERQSGRTLPVLAEQLTAGLADLDASAPFHIAYEPVWAIGTGEVATTDQVAEAHVYIRNFINELVGPDNSTAILYGGSVKPDNAGELAKVNEVGGFLIGSASLKVESLAKIIEVSR